MQDEKLIIVKNFPYSIVHITLLRIFLRELGLERGPLSLVIG
jgi:hypothetical protein